MPGCEAQGHDRDPQNGVPGSGPKAVVKQRARKQPEDEIISHGERHGGGHPDLAPDPNIWPRPDRESGHPHRE